MIYACQICGKGKETGHNVSYSKRRTRRVFLPNLHWVELKLDGQVGKMRICMKCLKKMKKEGKAVTGKVSNGIKETKTPARNASSIADAGGKPPRKTKKKAN